MRILSLFCLFCIFTTESKAQICSKSQLPTNLQNGLVAFYPFCGNANDAGGNGYNGTITSGSVPFINDRFGNSSSAIQLGGGYITTSTAAFTFQQNQSFTISIWFTLETNASGGRLLSTECPEGNFRMATYGNGRYGVQFGDYMDDSVALNTWTHLVYTYDNRSEKIYINGVLKYVNTEITNLIFNHCAPLTIGAKASSAFDRWTGKADDLMVFNRVLNSCEVSQLNNATANSISSIQLPVFNPLADTTRQCGSSTSIDAGTGFSSYVWNTGATTQSITATSSGFYKVTVTNASGCSTSDSTYLSLVKAKIIQRDTTICKGSSITLHVDSSFTVSGAANKSQLPLNLQNGLVAYYPFNGNVNDESGNGNNGTITAGAVPFIPDMNGKPSSAVQLGGGYIVTTPSVFTYQQNQAFTISIWFTIETSSAGGRLLSTECPEGNFRVGTDVNGRYAVQYGDYMFDQVPLNTWTHLVYTYDNKTEKFYVNGNLKYTNIEATSLVFNHCKPLTIGAKASSAFDRWVGKADDLMVYNRALSATEVAQLKKTHSVTWSTNATTNSITVTPTQTTKYYVNVSDGITTCQDSITVNVIDPAAFNPLQDTTRVCGSTTTLDAGSATTYTWNTGATTRNISPATSGFYKVTARYGTSCLASDSTYLSLVKAKIIQRDTTICNGASLTLNVDSSLSVSGAANKSQLPLNLQNGLVAYYPFNGNANDESGNGFNGVVNGATLTKDRFGNANNAYRFQNSNVSVPMTSTLHNLPIRTMSLWFYANGPQNGGRLYETTYRNGGIGLYNGNILDAWYGVTAKECNVTSVNTGTLNTWHHLVYISNSVTGLGQVFLDGILVKERIGAAGTFAQNWQNQFMRFGVGASNENFAGDIDDILIYNRELTINEIQSLYNTKLSANWSNGSTSNAITVSPTRTTKYFVTVSDGITSCKDSITVTVNNSSNFNPLQDTVRACGDSVILDAGSGYSAYNWNNGATTQKITVKSGGKYVVNVSSGTGCTSSDSTLVSAVKAKITQRDTTICKGSSVTLNVESNASNSTACNASQLPANLQNGLVAYYPFCGNANDASGNGNNGIIYGAQPAMDRYGNTNAAFSFNGINQYIQSATLSKSITNKTYSAWVKLSTLNQSAGGLVGLQSSDGQIFDVAVYNETNNGWGFGSDYLTRSVWSGVKETALDWVMITATYEQNSYKLYRNGVLIGSTSQFGITNFATTSKINIGYRHTGGGSPYLNAIIDDAYIYDRVLTQQEIASLYNFTSVNWSTGSTANSITVNPTKTTKYYVTVSDGITSCQDSVTITVNDLNSANPLQDTIRVCDSTVTLDAGAGYASYKWNTGATSQTITPIVSGFYKVNFTNAAGCVGSDSSYLSLVSAKIVQNDTTICKGGSISLSVDTLTNLIKSRFKYIGATQSRAFYLSFADADWAGAIDTSYQLGGRLAVLNTLEKDTLVSNMLKRWAVANVYPLRPTHGSAWIGLKQNKQSPSYSEPAGGWEWISGDPFTYQNWQPGEPNNNSIESEYGITNWNNNTGKWDDASPQYKLNYLLEVPEQKPLQITWSTNQTGDKITVSPTQTTKYYVTVSDGISSCRDSILVNVDNLAGFNPLVDTTRVCGDSVMLDAGSGYSVYNWSNGATSQKINVKSGGKYVVNIINTLGCTGSDSTLLSIVQAKIIQRDTTICKGQTINLSVNSDTSLSGNWTQISTQSDFYTRIVRTNDGKYLSSAQSKSRLYISNDLSSFIPFSSALVSHNLSFGKDQQGNLFYGSGGEGIFKSVDNGASWQYNVAAGFGCGNLDFVADDQNILYTSVAGYLRGLYVSKDGGKSWVNSFSGIDFTDIDFLSGFNKVFIISGGKIWYSANNGSSWNLMSGQPFSSSTIMVKCYSSKIFVFTNTGDIYTSSDGGSTWNFFSKIILSSTPSTYLNDAIFTADGTMFVSIDKNGVFQSVDNGKSWKLLANGISGNPSYLFFDNNTLLATTSLGIFKLNQINSSKSISWSTGSTSNSITISPTQTTKYFVTVSDGITSCQDSVTVTVAELDTAITALDPSSVCSTGGNVRLQAGVANTYQWLKDGTPISGATARLYSATQTGSYRVVVTNTPGCADTSRIISIVLDPKPLPNFTVNNSAQCLTENGFNFTNTSTIPSGTISYSWSLGDNTTATTTDVSKTYTTAGTFNIKLIATSDRLCVDSITKQITVYPQPPVPVITGPDEFCKGSSINLQSTGIPLLNWYRNNVLLTGENLNTLRITQGGDYKVISTNNNGCKSSSIVKAVIENPLPTGTFDTPATLNICEGSSLTLSASGASTYQWFYNNTAIPGATGSTYKATAAGAYTVDFYSNKSCLAKGVNSYTLKLLNKPDAIFSYDTYCAGVQTNFSSKSIVSQSGLVRYFWQFGDGKVSSNGQNAFNTYANAGNYRAKLIVTPVECPQLADTAETLIAIQNPPAGIAYPPVNAIINRAQQLTARNIGVTYQWTPSSYLTSSTSRTPTITTSKEQLYFIYIKNQAGCNIVDSQLVRVFPDRNIYVPEGFTPDNDGHNDRLYPIPVGIKEMKAFRIYNRWGLLVFDNKNANVSTGWDGNFNGIKQMMDTYAWIAEGIDIDGKFIRKTGNTILIR